MKNLMLPLVAAILALTAAPAAWAQKRKQCIRGLLSDRAMRALLT